MGCFYSRPLVSTDKVAMSRFHPKDATPYVLGGTREALKLFDKMVPLIPVPFVESGVKLALGILEVIQTIRANKEMCQTLLTQLGQLMIVVMRPFVNRSAEDIPVELHDNLKELERRLGTILATLKELRAARWWNAVLQPSERSEKLKECQTLMDEAMSFFEVRAQIDAAMTLDVLTRDVGIIKTDVIAIARDVQDMRKVVLSEPVIHYPSLALPFRPEALFGRGADVELFATCLAAKSSPRLAILGPGGIGKTSIALEVVADSRVTARYGDRIHWVPAAEVTTTELLVELVARSMNVGKGEGGDRKRDTLQFLRSSTETRLLLLDNFETPWDIAGKQSDIEDFLCDLAAVPHLAILLTMRADQPPSTPVHWTDSTHLPVISAEAARDLYLDIHDAAKEDASLELLLREMAYMPLAVRLMATRGLRGEMPKTLLELWERLRTKMLDQGGDRRTSIKISIEMSLNSNLMKGDSDALTLLSILAELPGGARPEFLPNLAPAITDIGGALATLLQAALAHKEPVTGLIRVLSPVRSFILHQYPTSTNDQRSIHQAYCALVHKYNSTPGDDSWSETQQRVEFSLHAYSEFQYWSVARVEIIDKAVRVAREIQSPRLLAEGLSQQARLLIAVDRYELALKASEEALQVHRTIGNQLGAAKSLKVLSDSYRKLDRYEDAVKAVKEALAIFVSIEDQFGVAESLSSLSCAYRMLDRYDDAVKAGKEALELFRAQANKSGVAQTLSCISRAYRMLGRCDDAVEAGEEARDLSRVIGDQYVTAESLWNLSHLYRMLDRYSDAVEAGKEALFICRTRGDQSGAAQSLYSLSYAYWAQDRYEDAVGAGDEALVIFRTIGNQSGAAESLGSLSCSHRMLDRYDDAVNADRQALEIFHDIGDMSGVADSLNSLSHSYRLMARYDDAVATGREALDIFRTIGAQIKIANSLITLGDAYRMNNLYDDAVMAGKEALDIYRASRNQCGTAESLKSLSAAYIAQGRYEEAMTSCEEAVAIFRTIEDQRGTAKSLRTLGRAYWLLGHRENALRVTEEALNIYKRLNSPRWAQKCRDNLAEFSGLCSYSS